MRVRPWKALPAILLSAVLLLGLGLAVPSINVNVQGIGAGSCDVVSPASQANVFINWNYLWYFGWYYYFDYVNITFSDTLPSGTYWYLNITIDDNGNFDYFVKSGTLTADLLAGEPLHIINDNIQYYSNPDVVEITIVLLSPDSTQCYVGKINIAVQEIGIGSLLSGSTEGKLSIPIHEQSGSTLTNYAVEFNLSGSWNYPYFTDANGNRLYYWYRYDPDLNVTFFWVLMNLTPYEDTVIYLYWGDASSYDPTYVNPEKVFLFFDDFSGTSLDTTKWNYYGTVPPTVSNSQVTLDGGQWIWTKMDFPTSYVVIANASLGRPTNWDYGPFYAIFINLTTGVGYGEAIDRGGARYYDNLAEINIYTGDINYIDYTSNPYTLGTWSVFQIFVNSDGTVSTFQDLNPMVAINGLDPIVSPFAVGQSTGGPSYFDWIAIRKHVTPEPKVETPDLGGSNYLVIFRP